MGVFIKPMSDKLPFEISKIFEKAYEFVETAE